MSSLRDRPSFDHEPPPEEALLQFMELHEDGGDSISPEEFCQRFPAEQRPAVLSACDQYLRTKRFLEPESIDSASSDELPEIPGFEVHKELGRGGMGVVFLAQQLSLNRKVALKLLPAHRIASERQITRFQREAEAAAKLSHPNIVNVLDFGQHRDLYFFAMEYVPGQSLSEYIREQRQQATFRKQGLQTRAGYIREVASITAKIADALHYAHTHRVIHRDVKPANILLTETGVPRLVDFGLAKDLDQATISAGIGFLGTPSYASPEQVSDIGKIDGRTDLYSLGVTLHEMLTLRTPHEQSSIAQIYQDILHRPPDSIRKIHPKVPRDLETICLKTLEKDPGKRYLTAGDFSADLQRFLNYESILARPPSPLRALWRSSIRHRGAAAVIFLLVALVAAGLFLQQWFRVREAIDSQFTALRAAFNSDGAQASDTELAGFRRNITQMLRDPRGLADEQVEELQGYDQVLNNLARDFRAQANARWREGQKPEKAEDSNAIWAPKPDFFWDQLHETYRRIAALDPSDAEAKERSDWRSSLPLVSIIGDASHRGARISVRSIDLQTGEVSAEKVPIGTLPLRDYPIATGYYRIVVEQEGLGYCEYSRFFEHRGDRIRVEAKLLPTAETVEDMVPVPAGPYISGCEDSDPSIPYRIRDLAGFYIDRYEVSVGQYVVFLDATGTPPPSKWGPDWRRKLPLWQNKPMFPASLDSAKAYAEWCGKRLPTTFEWEKAARGPDGHLYPWGNEVPSPGVRWAAVDFEAKNYLTSGIDNFFEQVWPVDRTDHRDQSVYGVWHLQGNVSEWTETMVFYPTEERTFTYTHNYMARGSYVRNNYSPSHGYAMMPNRLISTTGIRCVKSLDP
jgi:serine/threonine protein kinase/formylglycine-generating enzyme required for sulfatase activity